MIKKGVVVLLFLLVSLLFVSYVSAYCYSGNEDGDVCAGCPSEEHQADMSRCTFGLTCHVDYEVTCDSCWYDGGVAHCQSGIRRFGHVWNDLGTDCYCRGTTEPPCITDADCSSGEICGPDGICLPGCTDNSDCPSGQICDRGNCIAGCTDTCTTLGTFCDGTTGYHTCADSNLDGCKEWGATTTCPVATPFCTGSGVCAYDFTARWIDHAGITIATADKGDTVRMMAQGTDIQNKDVDFQVSKKTGGVLSVVLNWFRDLFSSDNINGGTINNWSTSNAGTYVFQARVSSTTRESGDLAVGDIVNNTAPRAIITQPTGDIRIRQGDRVEFKQRSIDSDDPLKIIWDFGDGTTTETLNYWIYPNPAMADTSHVFSTTGHYEVLLIAQEMDRWQEDVASINVYVYKEGINVMPVISEPLRRRVYNNSVRFNASQSHVANCSLAQAGCPGGVCDFTAGALYCYYVHRPGTPKTASLSYPFRFEWTFIKDNVQTTLAGNWSDYDSVVLFSKYFDKPGEHTAKLKLTYSAQASETQKKFIIQGMSCRKTATTSYWFNESRPHSQPIWVVNNAGTQVENCFEYSSPAVGSCCPENIVCSGSLDNGVCGGSATYCWDLTPLGEQACNNADTNIGGRSATASGPACNSETHYTSGGVLCTNTTRCKCAWDSQDNECSPIKTFDTSCGGGPGVGGGSYCKFNVINTTDNCDKPQHNIVLFAQARWTGGIGSKPLWCKDEQRIYNCPSGTQLGFFSSLNLAVALLLLIGLYAILIRKKSKN